MVPTSLSFLAYVTDTPIWERIAVVPELLESPLGHSIVGRAIRKGLVEIHVHNLRKYGIGPRKNVDDYSYGGDAGMVMMVEPVYRMIEELKAERPYDEAKNVVGILRL